MSEVFCWEVIPVGREEIGKLLTRWNLKDTAIDEGVVAIISWNDPFAYIDQDKGLVAVRGKNPAALAEHVRTIRENL